MLEGNKCEACHEVVTGSRTQYSQTKYCLACARSRKRANTLSPWTTEQKREFQRKYMRGYRLDHPGLSTRYVRKHRDVRKAESNEGATCLRSFAFLPLLLLVLISSGKLDLSIEALPEAIRYLEALATELVIKVTGLVTVVLICWRHVRSFFKDKEKPRPEPK